MIAEAVLKLIVLPDDKVPNVGSGVLPILKVAIPLTLTVPVSVAADESVTAPEVILYAPLITVAPLACDADEPEKVRL